jgi:hypothetical protein
MQAFETKGDFLGTFALSQSDLLVNLQRRDVRALFVQWRQAQAARYICCAIRCYINRVEPLRLTCGADSDTSEENEFQSWPRAPGSWQSDSAAGRRAFGEHHDIP